MRAAIDETERRRSIQDAYNQEHGIVPKTIIKGVREIWEISKTAEEDTLRAHKKRKLTEQERAAEIAKLEKEMREASKMLEFEYAAVLRDRIIELRGGEVTSAKSRGVWRTRIAGSPAYKRFGGGKTLNRAEFTLTGW